MLLPVRRDPLEEASFVVVAALRLGVHIVPHRQFVSGERLEVLFDELLFCEPQVEVLIEPGVHGGSRGVVVVVGKLRERRCFDEIRVAEERVQLLELREALRGDLDRPIVGAGQAEGARGNEGGNADVALGDAEVAGILTGAAPLHGRRNHDGGERRPPGVRRWRRA